MMKFLVVFLTACVLGSAVAVPGWLSSMTSTVSDTSNAMRQTAIGVAKQSTSSVVNAAKEATSNAVSVAKGTTSAAVSVAKGTTSAAINAAATAKNMTVSTAVAGINLVKDISMGAVNTGISFIIDQVKNIMKKTGKNVLTIPDINQKAGPIGFSATKGYFKDITTITQDGKPNVTTSGGSLKIDFAFKLSEIDIGYEQFNVTMLKMNVGGGIKVHIKNDTFIAHLRLTPGFTCALNVEKIEVAVLAGYQIDFTNMGKKSEWLLEKASNMITNAIKGTIKSKVQDAIDQAIKNVLKENATLCSKFIS